MNFTAFIASLYSEVANKSTSTLTFLRQITVRQLAELSSRRVLFMEDSAIFTLPVAAPYGGEWADASLAEFPPDIMEIDDAYYQAAGSSSGWLALCGPVPIRDLRTYRAPLRAAQSPLSLTPELWAWWNGRFWVNALGADTSIRIDYWHDATRDRTTGAKITEASTGETNGWFERGEIPLRYAVLTEYFSMPATRDETQAGICAGQRNVYLQTLEREARMRKGSSLQAPALL